MIQTLDIEQGTQEWHDARQGKYTGSNAHKLLGSFGASEYAKAVQDSFKGNYWTKRGHILEDEAIEIYEQIRNIRVKRVGAVLNSNYPDCLYSPDSYSPFLEVKCFDEPHHMAMFNGDIPLKVLAQIHFGMMICEVKIGELVIYNPDLDVKFAFKIIPIKANRNIQNNFKKILKPKELIST